MPPRDAWSADGPPLQPPIEAGLTPQAAHAVAAREAAAWLRRRGTPGRMAIDVVLVVVIQFALTFAFIVLAGAVAEWLGHPFAAGAQWLSSSPTALPLAILLSDVGVVALLWYRLRDTGAALVVLGLAAWQLGQGARRAVILGLGAGAVTVVLSTLLGRLLERLGLDQSAQYNELIVPLQKAPAWAVVLTVLLGTFLAPVVEEAFFRGYMFRALRAARPAVWAYVISAAAFGAIHLLPTQFPIFFVSGLILAAAYDRSQNMLANITAHATNNAVAFALSLLPFWLPH